MTSSNHRRARPGPAPVWPLTDGPSSAAAIRAAAAAVTAGGVVAFPTDTLYGLAVDPRRPDAVRRLFAAKRRPAGLALPLIAADAHQVGQAARAVTVLARRLADRWWPGPLAVVLDAAPTLDPGALGPGGTVAIRVPAAAAARALARAVGHPITATSANRSGAPPAADPAAAAAALAGDLAGVLDAGPSPGGAPSTIVDARGAAPALVRDGAVPWARVLQSLA